jgi:uracil-DNA glycosylase family 4
MVMRMDGGGDNSDLLALLAWWREGGIDFAFADEPIDWTAQPDKAPGADFDWRAVTQEETAPPPTLPRSPAEPDRGRRPLPPPAPPVREASANRPQPQTRPPTSRARPEGTSSPARQAAAGARTLDDLEALLTAFEGCSLKATAKNLCFYRGSPAARLMIIGEAPGRDEDIAGKPFVGRAGQLLDRMLAAIGLSETDVHITNVVYWRPPGNRTPTPEEAEACRPFLERQIGLVAPEIILTLGGPAAKAILGVTEGIMKLRGRWRDIEVGGHKVPVMPTLHPAYLLRTPEAKRQAWRDLIALKLRLDELAKGPPA